MNVRGIARACCILAGVPLGFVLPALAGGVDLLWEPSSGATGYKVYSGSSSGSYGSPSDVGNTTQTTFDSMANCAATYFAVTAYNSAGDSGFSNEISTWPRPESGALSPSEGERGATLNIVVSGNNFEPGASVQFSSSGITVNSVTRNSCGQITVNITVSESAAFGPRDVSVINTNGVIGSSGGAFDVVGSPLPDVQNLRRTDKQ